LYKTIVGPTLDKMEQDAINRRNAAEKRAATKERKEVGKQTKNHE
jgi:hypothetical protein